MTRGVWSLSHSTPCHSHRPAGPRAVRASFPSFAALCPSLRGTLPRCNSTRRVRSRDLREGAPFVTMTGASAVVFLRRRASNSDACEGAPAHPRCCGHTIGAIVLELTGIGARECWGLARELVLTVTMPRALPVARTLVYGPSGLHLLYSYPPHLNMHQEVSPHRRAGRRRFYWFESAANYDFETDAQGRRPRHLSSGHLSSKTALAEQ